MSFTTRERMSHVARRLGFGIEPRIVDAAATVDDAIAAALDLSAPAPPPPHLDPPRDGEEARGPDQAETPYRYWLGNLVAGPRRIEERLTWFFTDHFATDIRKVRIPYLLYRQHLTIRSHATGSFADLLHAIAVDAAMLLYLDGIRNAAGRVNENFGREVLELYTLGRGNYSEADVVEASRAFSGWVVVNPEGRAARLLDVTPWSAVFVPSRHDRGPKTLLGVSGNLDAAAAVDVLLDHPATAETIAAKLWIELVGTEPRPATVRSLGAVFRRDYRVMDLVSAIAADPAFTADDAIRARVRTPLEKAIGLVQVLGPTENTGRGLFAFLGTVGYVPFRPPNPAGYPKGTRLLGPHQLIHSFDLAAALPADVRDLDAADLMARLGIFDVTETTRAVLDAAPTGAVRAALAINAPEYHVT